MNSINDLPPEILAHIFSFYIKFQGHRRFLRNIPLVCRRWNDLHSIPLLWVDLNVGSEDLPYTDWCNFGEKGFLSFARNLNFGFSLASATENEVVKLICYCHNVTCLRIYNCKHSKVLIDILVEKCPNIESFDLHLTYSCNPWLPENFGKFLKVCGKNLKRLNLCVCDNLPNRNIVSTIANFCHSLEELIFTGDVQQTVKVDELAIRCPKLRKLELFNFNFVSSGMANQYGFANMVSFHAHCVDFGGMDVYSILKCSKDLEILRIIDCENLILSNISRIPSNKVKYFECISRVASRDDYSKFLVQAVAKWKAKLMHIHLSGNGRVLTQVLETYLHENPNPNLKTLNFDQSHYGPEYIEKCVLIEVIQAAKSLKYVNAFCPEQVFLWDRESIKRFLNALH